jgi:hypothetical protein
MRAGFKRSPPLQRALVHRPHQTNEDVLEGVPLGEEPVRRDPARVDRRQDLGGLPVGPERDLHPALPHLGRAPERPLQIVGQRRTGLKDQPFGPSVGPDDLPRGPGSDDLAVVDDPDLVGEDLRLLEVVGREEHRAAVALQAPDHLPDRPTGLGVESGRRLVQETDLGVVGEREGEAQLLLLAARKRVEAAVRLVQQVDLARAAPSGSVASRRGSRSTRSPRSA